MAQCRACPLRVCFLRRLRGFCYGPGIQACRYWGGGDVLRRGAAACFPVRAAFRSTDATNQKHKAIALHKLLLPQDVVHGTIRALVAPNRRLWWSLHLRLRDRGQKAAERMFVVKCDIGHKAPYALCHFRSLQDSGIIMNYLLQYCTGRATRRDRSK